MTVLALDCKISCSLTEDSVGMFINVLLMRILVPYDTLLLIQIIQPQFDCVLLLPLSQWDPGTVVSLSYSCNLYLA